MLDLALSHFLLTHPSVFAEDTLAWVEALWQHAGFLTQAFAPSQSFAFKRYVKATDPEVRSLLQRFAAVSARQVTSLGLDLASTLSKAALQAVGQDLQTCLDVFAADGLDLNAVATCWCWSQALPRMTLAPTTAEVLRKLLMRVVKRLDSGLQARIAAAPTSTGGDLETEETEQESRHAEEVRPANVLPAEALAAVGSALAAAVALGDDAWIALPATLQRMLSALSRYGCDEGVLAAIVTYFERLQASGHGTTVLTNETFLQACTAAEPLLASTLGTQRQLVLEVLRCWPEPEWQDSSTQGKEPGFNSFQQPTPVDAL